jgi:hypothetical protein
MTYEEILVQCYYLYDRSTLCTAHTLWSDMKWEISKDIHETLKKGIAVVRDENIKIDKLLGFPVDVVENKTNHIKLFIEVV